MEEREGLVFQAKLAEQAERYDGKPRLALGALAAALERWVPAFDSARRG